MYFVSIDLAFVTIPRVMLTIYFHSGPIVTFPQNILSHCMPSRIVPKIPSCISSMIFSASLLSTHRSKVESWLRLYKIMLLRKNLVENLLRNFLSFIDASSWYSWDSIYLFTSWNQGFSSTPSVPIL